MVKLLNNKKAWVAVVEASLAVVILFTFLFLAMGQRAKTTKSGFDFYSLNKIILKQVDENSSLRELILSDKPESESIKNYFEYSLKKFNNNVGVDVCISEMLGSCSSVNLPDKDVFASDFFVSSNSTDYKPKKLKVFMWEK